MSVASRRTRLLWSLALLPAALQAQDAAGAAAPALVFTRDARVVPPRAGAAPATPSAVRPPAAIDARSYLAALRARHPLDSVVAGATTDLARVRAMSRWARQQWEHNGSNEPSRDDPLTILAEARAGQRFRCVEYAEVLAGALSAVGVPARVLNLKTADAATRPSGAGHVVAEAYLRDQARWVMVDGQFDVLALRGGLPLSAVELQRAIAERAPGLTIESLSGTTAATYLPWITPYLHYFDVRPRAWSTGHAAARGALMLVPVGAPTLTVFQGRIPLGEYASTHSTAVFYAAPRP